MRSREDIDNDWIVRRMEDEPLEPVIIELLLDIRDQLIPIAEAARISTEMQQLVLAKIKATNPDQ
jgi:hypothetical protein